MFTFAVKTKSRAITNKSLGGHSCIVDLTFEIGIGPDTTFKEIAFKFYVWELDGRLWFVSTHSPILHHYELKYTDWNILR